MNNINWSEKVKKLDETIRKEIGIEDECDTNNILITVQTKSAESIEPAFIVGEDDVFLDLFVLSPEGMGITSATVIKENIQSIGVIGGVSTERIDPSNMPDERSLLGDIAEIYQ